MVAYGAHAFKPSSSPLSPILAFLLPSSTSDSFFRLSPWAATGTLAGAFFALAAGPQLA
jgi:hypothetical protein